jgi:putative membrane protein
MRAYLIASTAMLAALSLAACSRQGAQNAANDTTAAAGNAADAAGTAAQQAVDKVQDAASAPVGQTSAATLGSFTTDGFVTSAAMSDMYEIEAAKIAAQRSKSADIKKFAAMMQKDHTATTTELKGILSKASLGVTPPADLDERRKGMLDNLRTATPDNFDKTYMDQQVAAHGEAETLMKGYADRGDQPDLKAFAAKVAPKVQMHLDMARSLDRGGADGSKTPGT